MGIFTLVSASGSPGVTTTVLGLAMTWPRPVTVVEADPTGGSSMLAGFFKGTIDQPGLLQLVVAHRQGLLASSLPGLLLPIEGTGARLLAGIRSHDQSVGTEGLWPALLGALRDLGGTGQDVIVDAGRLGLAGSPMPLVTGSDAIAVLVGSSLPAVAGARSWAATLSDRVASVLGVVVVGEGRPYSTREVAGALGLPSWGAVEHAPAHAQVFSEGGDHPPARGLARLRRSSAAEEFSRSAYVRSLKALGETLRATTASQLTGDEVRLAGQERVG